jgi:hypothetical protein
VIENPQAAEQLPDRGTVFLGFMLTFLPGLLINFASGFVTAFTSGGPTRFLFFLGGWIALGQIILTLPLYLIFKKKGRSDTCRGLLIGAAVASLIGVSCGAFIISR